MTRIKKKIGILTSSRADYGILKDLILLLQKNKKVRTNVLITGSHLAKNFGYSIIDIKKDKIRNLSKIKSFVENTNKFSIIKSLSLSFVTFANYIKKNKLSLFLILGDRYELLPFCYTALLFKIPIIHIHGGEKTNFQLDDINRKLYSNMASYHFVSNSLHKKNVQKIIEKKDNVYNIGSLSLSSINKFKFSNIKELAKKYKINLRKKIIIVTFHPETIFYDRSYFGLKNLLLVLNEFRNFTIIFTGSNADENGIKFNELIKIFCKKNTNSYFFTNLGRQDYFSFLKIAHTVIGNSSSGIIEAPSISRKVINIGYRQNGRVRSKSVINVNYEKKNIKKALLYKMIKKKYKNPYYKENSVSKAASIIFKIINNTK
tara:strand:+ start:618 stop:1739 length:1122 start_codon:yes stop_codon:yes gene_type:complete